MPNTAPFIAFRRRTVALFYLLYLMLLTSAAQLMVALVPFRSYAKWLQRTGDGNPPPLSVIRSLRRKLDLAGKILPWEPKCLPLALTARFELSRRGYASSLFLGVDNPHTLSKAHAWLTCGSLFVTGRDEHDQYRQVARF